MRMKIFKSILCIVLGFFGVGCGESNNSNSNTIDPLILTPPRGVAMLHAMQPGVWEKNGAQIINVLLESKIKNVVINVLIDGSFGINEPHLNHLVHILGSQGRKVHLIVYLSNGASQRSWQSTQVNGIGTHVKPEVWRNRIKVNDSGIKNQFSELIITFKRTFETVRSFGGEVRFCPALEDNLDNGSFVILAGWIQEAMNYIGFGDSKIVRNPCPNCYPGNSPDVPNGFLREAHVTNPNSFNHADGVVSNDGKDWVVNGGTSTYSNGFVNIFDLISVRNKAGQSNNWFVLWNAGAQGLDEEATAPSKRNYKPYSPAEIQEIIHFLRG